MALLTDRSGVLFTKNSMVIDALLQKYSGYFSKVSLASWLSQQTEAACSSSKIQQLLMISYSTFQYNSKSVHGKLALPTERSCKSSFSWHEFLSFYVYS
jgi:hypothetical protein